MLDFSGGMQLQRVLTRVMRSRKYPDIWTVPADIPPEDWSGVETRLGHLFLSSSHFNLQPRQLL